MLDNTELRQPANSSPEPAAPVAGDLSRAPSASEAEDHSQDNRSWWSRFLHTRGQQSNGVSDASPEDTTENQEAIAPARITLTEEELQQRVAREAQSRFDRETARQNRLAAEAERQRLRDEDPWQYAQAEKDREVAERTRSEQTQQLMGLLGHVGRQHDAVSIDPVINALPEAERKRILELPNAGQGLPGRKLVVDEALKSYGRLEYERGMREARAKLAKDPVFRKSVLAEQRGRYAEPELYPGDTPRSEPEDNVSNRLRSAFYSR